MAGRCRSAPLYTLRRQRQRRGGEHLGQRLAPYVMMRRSASSIPCFRSLLCCLIPVFLSYSVLAQPATLSFSECTVGNAIDPSLKINVSTVYGQIVTGGNLGRHLNLTVIGDTGQTIAPISNDTNLLCEFSVGRLQGLPHILTS